MRLVYHQRLKRCDNFFIFFKKSCCPHFCVSKSVGYRRGMSHEPDSTGNDPLGLESLDREIRIAKLRRELTDLAGGEIMMGTSPDCDPAVEEAFLQHVLALETYGEVPPFGVLQQEGLDFPPPEKLDDTVLSLKLWELIRVLAEHRLYLYCTDHLSDRELYAWLWHDALRQGLMGFGLPFGNCHLDVLGGCSDQDIILSMRYYTDDEERARWATEFPDFPMPPREKPPFDRDRHLPKAPA
jgi:hypothetical protein